MQAIVLHAFKLIVAYDGTPFLGWQKTKTGPSVQETLENSLSTILQTQIALQGASRTDRGVHAKGQVASFTLPFCPNLTKLQISLCQLLPKEIAILDIEEVEKGFHATLSAKKKLYSYRLTTNRFQLPQDRLFEWHLPGPLQKEPMDLACSFLIGKKDFTSLTNKKKNEIYKDHIRRITSLSCTYGEGQFLFLIEGENFLYQLVRNIVGLLVKVGQGKISPHDIVKILEQRDRSSAAMSAPARGLTLEKIWY